MSFARITASLGLDISHFQSGLEKANASAGRFRKFLGGIGAGNLAGMVGVGALISGFTRVLSSAQQARDAAREIGKGVDISTLATARFADSFDYAVERIKAGATFLVGLGPRAFNAIATATGLGSSFEEQEALKRAEASQGEN